jgi:hypothetical protein
LFSTNTTLRTPSDLHLDEVRHSATTWKIRLRLWLGRSKRIVTRLLCWVRFCSAQTQPWEHEDLPLHVHSKSFRKSEEVWPTK